MMRSVPIVCLAAMLAAGCTTVNLEAEKTALAQRDRDWAQTTKDPERFMSFMASDATFYPPGMPAVAGTDAIRRFATDMMNLPGFSLSFTPGKAEVAASGDIGYTTGTYTTSMGGQKETGKYVTLWRKQDGAWKVVEDIFNSDAPPPDPSQHVMSSPSSMTWTDPPPGLPGGGKVAVISGDPSQAGPFVIRAQMPAGYTVPLHWHPTTENITVLAGTIAIGMEDTTKPATDLPAGSFVTLPATMRHVFNARTATTIQIHGTGPFAITYVNAADDPRNKK